MRTVFSLCLFAICVDRFTADTDPWASFFRQSLDEILKEASDSWPDEANVTNVTVTLVKRDDGWLSLRQGVLHNLSSWSLPENVTLKCNTTTTTTGIVTATVAFHDLPFTFSYWYDNGTSLASPRDLAGTLRGLAAQLVFRVQRFPVYYYSTTTFHLQKQNTSVELTGFNPENVALRASEVARTVRRALDDNVLTVVEQLVGKVLGFTIAEVDLYAVPRACTPTSTTTARTTAKLTTATTRTTKAAATTTTGTTKAADTTTTTTKAADTTTTTTKASDTTTGTTKAADTTTRTTKAADTTKGTTKAAATTTRTTKAADTTTRTTKRNAATTKLTKATVAANKTLVTSRMLAAITNHFTSATKTSSFPTRGIEAATAGKSNNPESEDERDSGKREHSSGDKLGDSSPDKITELNNVITDMLQKAVKHFTAWALLPYKTPNTEDEMYQKAEGVVVVNVTLKGLRKLAVSGDPHVERVNKTARVTANVAFSGVTYSAQLHLRSVDLEWTVEGDADQLTGQLIVNVNYENISAASVSLESFELKPFVLLTGIPEAVSSTARKHVDTSEVEDAVRGAFKMDVIHMLREEDSTLLDSAFQGDKLDMRSLLSPTTASIPQTTSSNPAPSTTLPTVPPTASTNPAPSTTLPTVPSTIPASVTQNTSPSAPSTSPSSVLSTTPSSATLPRLFQGRMIVLTSVMPMMLAVKMLV